MAKKQYKRLDPETMKEIVNCVIGRFQEEQEKLGKSKFDRRLRNTKLLLRNYRELLNHSTSAIYDASMVQDEDVYDVLEMIIGVSSESFSIESIKKSAVRTHIIIEHVKEMIALYEICCLRSCKSEDARRFRIIKAVYIDEPKKTPYEVADEEFIDSRTVYRDIDQACEKLAVLIFGIDGLRL